MKMPRLMIVGHKNPIAFSVKIIGLILDVVGSIMVAMSLVDLNHQVQNIHTVTATGLEQKAKAELTDQSNVTLSGMILIAIGFCLILGEETISSIRWT
jgi:hypothetical protein